MKLTVNLPKTPTHILKKVNCNGSHYVVPFPSSTSNFIEIVQSLEISKNNEKVLAILSKATKELSSIQQFYSVQQESLHFFNIKIELNTTEFAFSILSETEKALQELDKLKFSDFLSVLKHGYDSLSIKLHSKLNRRIKKYLAESQRDEREKRQIQQLINFIKESSSQEEEQELKPVSKETKLSRYENILPKQKVQKIVYEAQPQKVEIKRQSQEKAQIATKKIEQSLQIEGEKKREKKIEKQGQNQQNRTRKTNKNKSQNIEQDWEDIQEDKNNNLNKNMKKKIMKFGNQLKKDEEDFEDQNKDEEKIKPLFKEKENRTKYREKERENQGKRLFGSKEKPQRDMRILLGINGDTDDGWRERYRVSNVSNVSQFENKAPFNKAQKNKSKDNNDNSQTKEKIAKTKNERQQSKKNKSGNIEKMQKSGATEVDNTQLKKAEVIKIESKQKSLGKLFTFPNDGESYILKKNESYNLLVNKIFWVKLQSTQVVIQKVGGTSGFIRNCKFNSTEDFLVEAEDITLSLNGMSNLQDGGTKFGNPVIGDFTENDSQWFKIRELQIFGYI